MKSMSCKKCVSMADAYLDEALPQKDRQKVEAHLALCPECRTRFFEQKQLLSLLRSCAVSPPQDFRARVMERIERESTAPSAPAQSCTVLPPISSESPKGRTVKRFPFRVVAACIAAVIVAISAIGVMIHNAPKLLDEADIAGDATPNEVPTDKSDALIETDAVKDPSDSVVSSDTLDTNLSNSFSPDEHFFGTTDTASTQKGEQDGDLPSALDPTEPTGEMTETESPCNASGGQALYHFSNDPAAALPYLFIDQSEDNNRIPLSPPYLFDAASENTQKESVAIFHDVSSDLIPQLEDILQAYGSAFFDEYDLCAITLSAAPEWMECVLCDESLEIMLPAVCRPDDEQGRYMIYLPIPKTITELSVIYIP